MKVYKELSEFEKLDQAVVTTGTFDGVHKGHQIILNRIVELARKEKSESVLITFYPHPRQVLHGDDELRMINSQEEKIRLLEEIGIDHLVIIPFTKEFSRISSIDFIRNILVGSIGTTRLVIGYNHQFGRNREGTFEHLKEYGPIYGFEVEEIPAKEIENVNISSTKIRAALESGKVEVASEYLGYDFGITGVVVQGNQLGRTIGFPTANIKISSNEKLVPKNGVYAVNVQVGDEVLAGMMNIGVRPTIKVGSNETQLEVHIFDFNKEIYNEEVYISFVKRIRDEKQFGDINELKVQIEKDQLYARNINL